MPEILEMGAAELAWAIRTGLWTPTEVVEAHIARIEIVNPEINAVITPMFDQARAQAEEYTQKIKNTDPEALPPLFGVPVTIKDAIAVEGVRFTAGSYFWKDNIAEEDAEAVRLLKEAGAIILGKTNLPTMSGAVETVNKLFGRTRNPWNLKRSAGGSSGGEAAIIAAGGSPLGLGADIAGSIRLPAAFCGVVGLKPTAGRISTKGHEPVEDEIIKDFNVVGPMARRVEDLALALSVLSVIPAANYKDVKIKDRQVLVPKPLRMSWVSGRMRRALIQAVDVLQDAGMEVTHRNDLPLDQVAYEYIGLLNKYWKPAVKELVVGGQGLFKFGRELLISWTGLGRISPTSMSILAGFDLISPFVKKKGLGDRAKMDGYGKEILEALGSGGVLVWPVFPFTALPHGYAWTPFSIPAYTMVFNGLGFPSVVVPIGFDQWGLPLSIQVVAWPGEDETALAVAEVLEKHFGGWEMAPL